MVCRMCEQSSCFLLCVCFVVCCFSCLVFSLVPESPAEVGKQLSFPLCRQEVAVRRRHSFFISPFSFLLFSSPSIMSGAGNPSKKRKAESGEAVSKKPQPQQQQQKKAQQKSQQQKPVKPTPPPPQQKKPQPKQQQQKQQPEKKKVVKKPVEKEEEEEEEEEMEGDEFDEEEFKKTEGNNTNTTRVDWNTHSYTLSFVLISHTVTQLVCVIVLLLLYFIIYVCVISNGCCI